MIDIETASPLTPVPHGFLGRTGGVSNGLYRDLNVGVGSDDDALAIAENRRLAAQAIIADAPLQTVYQVHGADVVTLDGPLPADARLRADAMVTATPGLLIGILTADCAPVLLADAEAGVVGAAHAGWKGALTGVTDAAIAAMEALGADRGRIAAAVGPCIAQASYEVDEGFYRRFCEADEANDGFFAPGKEHHHRFDLEGYVAARLAAAGVRQVACLGRDTYRLEDRYFSYRRATHRGEPDYGRQISLIGLAAR
ncbi:peptidoglycan editing factor PgeF [Novosphingopyxis sp.]|uniref:peptidoglycan editing factor PgeF n=1 Tax=Novosphingopyxis sp. TaxID=2709690 RepID=UPI003B5B2A88